MTGRGAAMLCRIAHNPANFDCLAFQMMQRLKIQTEPLPTIMIVSSRFPSRFLRYPINLESSTEGGHY
jgi:hypothetical protein